MSVVTNIILCFGLLEEVGDSEVYPALEPIQKYLERQPLKSVREAAGGYKVIEAEVWMCGANYLDEEEFVNVVLEAPWQEPERVQLMLKGQDDSAFRVISIASEAAEEQAGYKAMEWRERAWMDEIDKPKS